MSVCRSSSSSTSAFSTSSSSSSSYGFDFCGDGKRQLNEECDEGSRNGDPSSNCTVTCQTALVAGCGNGIQESGEQCDPGGNCIVNGKVVSGCLSAKESVACKAQGGTCYPTESAACTDRCQMKSGSCGDGIVQNALGEECDDGTVQNQLSGNCDTRCHFVKSDTCGDGKLDPPLEQCDAGDRNGDGPEFTCRSNCILPWCGDGILDYNEECDDRNKINGDRCSAVCTIESLAAPPLTGNITALDAVLSSNRNPSFPGQPVIFTFTMRLDKPDLSNGAGQVQFTDERTTPATVLGTSPLVDFSASLVTTSLSAGSHSILGTFIRDGDGTKVHSNVVHQRVLSGNVPSPARSQTGPGLIIFLASGAAAGYGLVRRRLMKGGR